jgi:hypothetical protein
VKVAVRLHRNTDHSRDAVTDTIRNEDVTVAPHEPRDKLNVVERFDVVCDVGLPLGLLVSV